MTKLPLDTVYILTDKEIQHLIITSEGCNSDKEISINALKRKYFTYKELIYFADKLDDVLIKTAQTRFDDPLYEDQIQNAHCALEVLAMLQNAYKRAINAK